jgi:hypothetical protein
VYGALWHGVSTFFGFLFLINIPPLFHSHVSLPHLPELRDDPEHPLSLTWGLHFCPGLGWLLSEAVTLKLRFLQKILLFVTGEITGLIVTFSK